MTRYRPQQRSFVIISALFPAIIVPSWTLAQVCYRPNFCINGCTSSFETMSQCDLYTCAAGTFPHEGPSHWEKIGSCTFTTSQITSAVSWICSPPEGQSVFAQCPDVPTSTSCTRGQECTVQDCFKTGENQSTCPQYLCKAEISHPVHFWSYNGSCTIITNADGSVTSHCPSTTCPLP